MSAENVKWQVNMAVRRSNLPPAARLIMLVLSDMANAKTGEIPERHSPSLADLARDTGHGESTVKTQLAELERLGWVARSRPDAHARARHVPTGYRLAVGAPGDERVPLKRKPRARSKPSESAPEGQEQAIGEGQEMTLGNESEGQELTDRGPGANLSRARSKPSYIKDDDLYDQNDLIAADAAQTLAQVAEKPKRKRLGGSRKAAKPKAPDPLGDVAQELTVAFFERYKGRNVQPFPAVRGVVKTALQGDVPRDVLAHAMDAVVSNGFPISGTTLSVELTRMWNAANNGTSGSKPTTGQQRLADAARIAEDMRRLDEAEAASTSNRRTPNLFVLPIGRIA